MCNEKFMRQYNWLISPTNDNLFDDTENFLIGDTTAVDYGGQYSYMYEETFLQYWVQHFKSEVCSLVALYNKNISLRMFTYFHISSTYF